MSETRQSLTVPGSRWWKIDFHTHSPASNDYKKKDATVNNWLKAAMTAGLDGVVLTDHNSGDWIDKLKAQNEILCQQSSKSDWYHELTIFPGVEITVADSSSRIHLLAVFAPNYGSSEITAILGACGITSGFGDETNTAASKGFLAVVGEIKKAGGIAIPAHIDGAQGLLNEKTTLTPELKKSLNDIFAAEFRDIHAFVSASSDLKQALESIAKVGGSDAHKPDDIGKYSSWVKMSSPSIEGLRLALRDHVLCVKNQSENPNHDPDIYLTGITIRNMSVCGHIPGQQFAVALHPHFNSLIGGRGTGKSTLIESIRLATRRDQSLSDNPRVKEKIEHFVELSKDKGVMQDDTEILLELKRRGVAYQLRWRKDGNESVLDEMQNDAWVPVEAGDIQERFPVSIYSQKQIEELASNSRGLLEIIDRTPEVNRSEWQMRWDNTASQYFQLKERERDLSHRLAGESHLRVSLADVEKDLKQYEEKGHGEILKNYQKRTQQWNALPREEDFDEIEQQISGIIPTLSFSDFPSHIFDDGDGTRAEIQAIHEQAARELQMIAEQMQNLARDVTAICQRWKTASDNSKFVDEYKKSVAAYNALVDEYSKKQSSVNLATYGEWVSQRNQIQHQLRELESVKKDLKTTRKQIHSLQEEFKVLRAELLNKRTEFVKAVVGSNPYVRMEFVAFGDASTIEREYRNLLELDESRFVDSVYEPDTNRGILYSMVQWEKPGTTEKDLLTLLAAVKTQTVNIANGVEQGNDKRFAARLQRLLNEKPESFDRFDIWYPEDLLRVKYSSESDKSHFNDLEKGSAGQKAAAILAFLLSYGNEPLIIDQPEDDLDNALVYDLIVNQIHKNKDRRQLIIATHNPNIVVNGDSELVHVLKFTGGQIRLDRQGGLEEIPVRESICTIMEGGKKAFEQRYKRISLEDGNHV
ncbi:MAG: AAA family ATPase [Treponema sp.]|jgi:predicted metal-dependent phosphoesterase TrpH/predicted ATPase|nr:AAA family ATPase [Treponema sp.]